MQVSSLTKNADSHSSPPLKYYCKNYTLIEIIKKKPQSLSCQYLEQTCIVRNPEHQYLVAKKLPTNDKKILHEIQIFRNVRHPNIISMKQCFIERDNLYVIEEFCQEGDLLYHIKRQIRKKQELFSQNLIGHWLLQTLLAVEYLHNEKIIHRDIRPANLFLTSSGHIKLGSFKHSKALDSQLDFTNTILTSPYYMAPQLFQHKCYDYKIDIWAIGCLLYQICNLKVHYQHVNMVQQINRMNKIKPQQLPSIYSRNLVQIYHKCKKKNPLQRATALQLLKTSYFVDLMAKFIKNRDLAADMGRIPIKKYKIHNIHAKDRIKSAKSHQSTAGKSGKSNQTPKTQPFLRKNSRQKSRQKNIFQQRPPRSNSRPSSRQVQKSQSKQKKVVGNKINLSKEKQKKKINSPNLPPMAPSPSQQLHKKTQKQIQKQQKNKEQSTPPSAEKVAKHPPLPLLKPPKLIQTKNQVQSRSRTQAQEQLNQFVDEQSFSSTPNKLNEKNQSSKTEKESITDVHDSLAKIFADLKLREDDDQQFSFDLEQESQIRLTSTHDNSAQITSMYHSKLNQLIDEINYKYCPDMECIQQRTNQFDSNQFAKIKGFIAQDVKRGQFTSQ